MLLKYVTPRIRPSVCLNNSRLKYNFTQGKILVYHKPISEMGYIASLTFSHPPQKFKIHSSVNLCKVLIYYSILTVWYLPHKWQIVAKFKHM